MTLDKFIKESTEDRWQIELLEKPTAHTVIYKRAKGATVTFEPILVQQAYNSKTKKWADDYPASEEWGVRAFSCMTLDRAREAATRLERQNSIDEAQNH